MSTNTAIRVTDIPRVLDSFYGSGRMPYFRGQPGCGKTDLVHQAARDITTRLANLTTPDPYGPLHVYELHLASMSEVDVRGYLIPGAVDPDTGKIQAQFTQPVFADVVKMHPRGILFLDEMPQATQEVQKAVAPLVLEGRIGDYQLPAGWMVVAAGNREEDNAGVNAMLSHLINRMSIIDVNPPEADDWIEWAARKGLSHEFLAFAKIKPSVLFGAPDLSANDQPYCTPRSMHALSDVSARWPGGIGGMVNDKVGMAVVEGFIGKGAMAELRGVINLYQKLPKFEEVIADPDKVAIPTEPDLAYAALMMVALRADGAKHLEQAIAYTTRFNPNFAVVGLCALVSRDMRFTHSKTLGTWIVANKTMMQKLGKYIQTRKA